MVHGHELHGTALCAARKLWYPQNVARGHLAWNGGGRAYPAFTAPMEVLHRHLVVDQVCRVVCTNPPVKGMCIAKSALWCYDAAPIYRAFAREEALRVAHLWDPPPIVLRYLKTGDESIRKTAWDAARAATAGTSRGAPWAATFGATQATAWAAAGMAAWAAAREAARTAIWATARAAAAGDATQEATQVAARRRQNRRLAQLLAAGHRLYGQRTMP